VVTIRTTSLTFNNSTFCPHSVFMCSVWISEQTAIISLYSINWSVFMEEKDCAYWAVRTGVLYAYSIQTNCLFQSIKNRFSYYLCLPCPQQLYGTCKAKPLRSTQTHTCTGIAALTDATIRWYNIVWDKFILSRVWMEVLFREKRMENGRRFVSSSIVSARMQHPVWWSQESVRRWYHNDSSSYIRNGGLREGGVGVGQFSEPGVDILHIQTAIYLWRCIG